MLKYWTLAILLAAVLIAGAYFLSSDSGFPPGQNEAASLQPEGVPLNSVSRIINDPPCPNLSFAEFETYEEDREEDLSPSFLEVLDEGHRNALKRTEEPNFAGKYYLSSVSCGENCFRHLIFDGETNAVLGEEFKSSFGIEAEKESRLLVVNPPQNILSDEKKAVLVEYFVLERGDVDGDERVLHRICSHGPLGLTNMIKEKVSEGSGHRTENILAAIFYAENRYLRVAVQYVENGEREDPGRYVFAKKEEGDWRIVFNGRRPYSCNIVRDEGFPEYMFRDCEEI